MTCGRKECKREWHKRKCADWNRNNPEYFKGNYLRKKLEAMSAQKSETAGAIRSKSPPVVLRLKSGIDPHDFKEVFTLEQAIVMEYLIGQFIRISTPDTS